MNVTIRYIDTFASYGEATNVVIYANLTRITPEYLAFALREREAELCGLSVAEVSPYLVEYFFDDGFGQVTFAVRTTGLGDKPENNMHFPGLIEYPYVS